MSSLLTYSLPLIGQSFAVAIGIAILALVPPAHGTILLVSATRQPVAEIANAALAAGALIARRGPGDHSLIVVGDRNRLFRLSRRGLIPLAAPAILCAA
jgi:hypothetical protein